MDLYCSVCYESREYIEKYDSPIQHPNPNNNISVE